MFSKHLRILRKNLNLSQHQLATKLNLASDEFLSIDANTVSRWERGIIKPTLSKQLRILRCFTTDLMPYLKSLNHPISSDKLNRLLYTRFQNVNIRLATASYKKTAIEKKIAIEEMPLFDAPNDHTIDDIKYLHTELDIGYPGLFDINLYQYHRDKKAIGKKFINKDTKALIGHSVSLIFDGGFIESSVKKTLYL
ncbi:hypothetical protein VIOR3934_17958 [Vibrio orientalis CIP 102891 = ATCC 33934]|uniref:HTH cro/C1-type domain-containing protein n=1 Tax=Vibrio orientalis CIP 102891 = ATCC 33934 TaxID=675816 RepID=F9SWU8_VIBOR|nr:helix-turn-helix transcriptional regulator [Vibrio orientalis]EGU47392.1 hypothetical protein VIOR3934_17958 [Vibrio orientalis CIP 102891 = ATCC 33934]